MARARGTRMAAVIILLAGTLEGVAAAADAPQFILAGVILVEGKVEKALLVERTLTRGQPLLVAKGDRVGPYRLVKVLEDQVVLARGNRELTIRLGAPASQPSQVEAASEAPSPGATLPAPQPDASVRGAARDPARPQPAQAERRQRKQTERRADRSAPGSKGASSDTEPAASAASSE